MNGYTVVGHDPLVLRVLGSTLGDLFEHAAFAVLDQVYVLESIPATYSRPVMAVGDTMGELLEDWLNELLRMSDAEQIAPSFFIIDRLEEGGVQGSAAGMPLREVTARGPVVVGLIEPRPDPIAVPQGWWVDLTVDVDRRLRSV